MAYCVFTCKKAEKGGADGGLSAHIDREKWDDKQHKMVPFVPQSVVHPERSHLNKEYLLPPGMGRTEAIEKRIKEAGITRKIRDDQAKFLAFVCSSDHGTMQKIYDEGRFEAWVAANISFMEKTFGKENVVGCAGHMDEVSYHLHFTVVPIIMGPSAERPDTMKQYEKRNGKEKRRYKKQEVVARLCAKDVFTPENAEQWQTDYALHMQAAGFDLQRGEHGSQAIHMDPAVHNAIVAEEAKIMAEKDGLEMQKEALADEVEMLQTEKRSLTLDIDALNKQKTQTEKAVKGLETMCTNLTTQKNHLSTELTDLQSELSAGKISLSDYQAKKSAIEDQISKCDTKLADKQHKLEAKNAELQTIIDKVNHYNVFNASFQVPHKKITIPRITERPPRLGNIDEWMKVQNARIREQFEGSLDDFGKTVMDAAEQSIIAERALRLQQQDGMAKLSQDYQRETYLRRQLIHDVLGLLDLFEIPGTAKIIYTVAFALMGGEYVSVPCAGGGSVSSEEGWDGRKKDEDDESFRLRCWLHAAKTVRTARRTPTISQGYKSKR